jgi:hypothetical protein
MKIPALLAVVVAMTIGLTGVATAATPSLELPPPTGPLSIGLTTLHLTDRSRADPWVPSERRELMVSVWYPARATGGATAPYMTQQESAAIIGLLDAPGAPADAYAKVKTHSSVDAKPLGLRAPLVVLSPGFTVTRAELTSLAEDLASRGYVVAGIGHNYESAATTFPDGHTTTCVACALPQDRAKIAAGRVADVSFVLNELTGPKPVWGGGKLIDASRIAMVGHSAGGYSAIPAMRADSRIDAGLSLDGIDTFDEVGTDRPFLMMGVPEHQPNGTDPDASAAWDKTWPALTGWKRWFTVDKSDHFAFTDNILLAQQLGIDLGDTLPGTRGVQITRAYVDAFVNRHLRGCPEPLLNGPTGQYPEVRGWTP